MKIRRTERIGLVLIIMIGLLISAAATAFADEQCSINVSPNLTAIEVTKGGREQVDLSGVFSDSLGHNLTYTLDKSEESLKARIKDGILLIDPLELGEFEIKITAKCETGGAEKQITMPVNIVESEDEGNPAQYGYDETPAESATAIFTASCDGVPLRGNDAENTILAHLKVKVPYFDLGLYGLEKYYRYHTKDGRGVYIDDEVVERPTAMHLFIYVTEKYYMGIPEEKCCKGTSGLMEFNEPVTMLNMYGEKAYNCKYRAYCVSGGPTSSFMNELWGHDMNLMYYRNHFFPLMSPGWGSTSDYQLLSDGDTFDVGMYSDWNFYQSGAFCCFGKEEYKVNSGEMLLFSTLYTSSSEFGSGELKPMSGLKAEVYDDEWNKIDTVNSETAGFGYAFQKPGIYHLIGLDVNAGTDHANKSPATADVIVTDSFADYPFDKIIDQKGKLIPRIKMEEDIPDVEHYHVSVPDGTSEVKVKWPNLPDKVNIWYWDYESGAPVQVRSSASIQDDVITFDPASWKKGVKAALLCDGKGEPIGAFTFSFYTPGGINFAPVLKAGVKSLIKENWRERKDYAVNLSDIFIDYDGDGMTYTVTVDDAEPAAIQSEYSYQTEIPGRHTLVFTPVDSRGAAGDTHTIELNITENQKPDLKDPENSSKTVDIRYDEKAKLNLLDVFDDFDNDHLTYRISKDNEAVQEIDPEEIKEYGAYITPTTRESWPVRYMEYTPSGKEDIGKHVFRIRAWDGLGESEAVYDFTVNVVENRAPVPQKEELTEYCMAGHYWSFDPQLFFTDPEGDKILSYKVSVNGSAPVTCDRYRHLQKPNCHRILMDPDVEKYVVQFFAEDSYGSVGTCTANVYTKPEQLEEIQVNENSFSAQKNGYTEYKSDKDEPATHITGFRVSKNVTLRNVRYSEENGDFTYYLDVDDLGISEDETFTLTMDSEQSEDGLFVGPKLGGDDNNAIQIRAVSGDVTEWLSWYGDFYATEAFIGGKQRTDQFYRIVINMVNAGDPDPQELILEPKQNDLYVGELADRCVVKARYSDGVIRYVSKYLLSDLSFASPGTHVLTASALGLTAEASIKVKAVPQNMIIINDLGKYGRVRLAEILDYTGEPIEDAVISLSDPVTDPEYDDSKYDGSVWGGIPDMLRKTYDIDVRIPAGFSKEHIKVRFEMLKDLDYSVEYIMGEMGQTEWGSPYHGEGENVANDEQMEMTNGYLTINLSGGKGSHPAMWIDRKSGLRDWWHSYDLFNVSVKTGACEIIGKVSSWDDKENADFLVYPGNMSEEDIRTDAKGEHEHALRTSATVEKAVKNGGRYEHGFKVEGLDAGNYKLAVVKPGKYVVPIVSAELDGTANVGSLPLRLYGDINNDGLLDVRDVTQIARFGVGKRQFTEEESLAADVNLDKTVDVRDITQLCRKIVGKSSSLDMIS